MAKLGGDFAICGWNGDRDKGGTLDAMSKFVLNSIDLKVCAAAKE